MATLEKIRSKAVLLVIVVGVALFAFIIGDFLRSGSTFFNQQKENIVVVDGKSVHYQDYQAKVEERTNAIKMRNGNVSLTDDDQNQIRQMVLDEMIDDILFSEEAEKLGLVISKEEMVDLVMGDNISPVLQQIPDFKNPQTGMFDKDALLRFLQMVESDNYDMYPEEYLPQLMEMKKSWMTMEQQIMKDQLRRKFNALVSSVILVNDIDAKTNFEGSNVSVDFDYVSQAYNSIPDEDVSVSDAEIQKLYNQRINLFKQDEAKVIDYIAVSIMPDPADYEAVNTKLENLKENFTTLTNVGEIVQNNSDIPYVDAYVSYSSLDENMKNFAASNPVGSVEGPVLIRGAYHLYKIEDEKVAPDSVKLNVLMMPMVLDESEIIHLSDSLMQVVKGGVAFADMALEATGGQTNGEMGWITEAQLVSQFDSKLKDEVFYSNVNLNEPFIAKSNTGMYLLQITEKTNPVKKYKLANIQVTVAPSQETKTRLYNEFSQFVSANHSLEALKENASAAGYAIQTDVEIAKDQMNIGGIQSTRQIIQWAFNNNKGAISDIYECQNNEYFVVAAIENTLKEGYRPLTSVSDLLKRELLNEKKGEKLVADLKAKNFTSMEQYAGATNTTSQSVRFVTFNTSNITGVGVEPILNAKAPLAPVGEISGPFAGETKAYVIYVTDKKANENQTFDPEVQKRQMQMQNTYRMYQLTQSSEILKEGAKIENNFSRFF